VSSGIAPSYTAEDSEHRRLIEDILRACQRHDIVAGVYCGSAKTAKDWREQGFRMLALVSDAVLLRHSAQEVLRDLRHVAGREEPEASYA
jgi:2-keto-3-deoxy-L-rhamnonate aldolase RhmA